MSDEGVISTGNKFDSPDLHKRWKLEVCEGRQIWKPIPLREDAENISRYLEKHLLTKRSNDDTAHFENPNPTFPTSYEAVDKAIAFYSSIQTEDGHWAGDYGGPMFLLPGLVATLYISDTKLPQPYVDEMIRYLSNRQRDDGGWGLHIEGQSTVFGTAMNYVAMRLLGVDRDDPRSLKARCWLYKHKGARYIPSWGRFWLATLNLYPWEGLNPLPPELWYLPEWLPFHPGRWWCHCRVVYLPMAYIYGIKGTAKLTPLLEELREELYVEPYDSIDWKASRNMFSKIDQYRPDSKFLDAAFAVLSVYEGIHNKWVRKQATNKCYDHIIQEDINTKWICIGPVNKVLNMLSVYYTEGKSENFQRHLERVYDYLWLSDDGMKMQGYNGSQLWDTAFAAQAIIESGLGERYKETLQKAYQFVECAQVLEDVPNLEKYYRHISKGAWPFSTRDHGWPISDCTAEGLKAALLLQRFPFIDNSMIGPERMYDAVNVILSMQNAPGGWATYELTRTSPKVEVFNASQVFGDIMIDYPYVECTSACMQALALFRKRFPDHRAAEIADSIKRGANFIKSIQRPDGSWYGSWAICFCYAAWFGINGLLIAGESPASPAIKKACDFLVKKQMADGGWGEHYMSCVTKEYTQASRSQIINTAWSLLALMAAGYPDRSVIDRGIQLLMRRQLPNGDFPQENISGVFNGNCMITYTNYRNIFPIWALGKYVQMYGENPTGSPSTSARL